MAKWSVYATVRGSKYLGDFEGDTPEEAQENALRENGWISLCWQCSSEVEDAEIETTSAEPA